MMEIALQPVANQSFTAQLDGARYVLTIKEASGCMVADVARDDVVLVQGVRLVAGSPVLPYPHLEAGNFVVLTENDDLPDFTKFGSTQVLIYASASELAALRG